MTQATQRNASICRSKPLTWFQLANIRLTTHSSNTIKNLRAVGPPPQIGIEPVDSTRPMPH